MRFCKKCKTLKEIKEFDDKTSKKGKHIQYACRSCIKKYNREYNKKYYKKNCEKLKDVSAKWHAENKERRRLYDEQYYILNKNSILEYQKQYSKTHHSKINSRLSKYRKIKTATDPSYKLRRSVSRTIHDYLKRGGGSKNKNSCIKHLPFTIEELRQHLEAQFEPWMNWNNHGKYIAVEWKDDDPSTWKWQIDHIVPQSKLSYSNMNDDNFQKCWNLANLRPYSAKQNILDSNKR